MLRRHEEFENGTAWSNSSESSDDSSSPQLPVGGLHNSTPHKVIHKIHYMLDMICSAVPIVLLSFYLAPTCLSLIKNWSVNEMFFPV